MLCLLYINLFKNKYKPTNHSLELVNANIF